MDGKLVRDEGVGWLFVLNFPNGGSTAFAKLLLTGANAVSLTDMAEGQWLIPSLSRPLDRWDPDHRISARKLRATWLYMARRRGGEGDLVVVEKSAPNMCRVRALLEAFGRMRTWVITMTRDPYATCASWDKRYGVDAISRNWDASFGGMANSETDSFRLLAQIWLRRARMLIEARKISSLDLSYEALCADPVAALGSIADLVPALADVDVQAALSVKDYPPQKIQDMNQRQIARLTHEQKAAIFDGLSTDPDTVAALGYSLQPPS